MSDCRAGARSTRFLSTTGRASRQEITEEVRSMTEQSGQQPTLDNLSTESRVFAPAEEFSAAANVGAAAYERGSADREAFWAEQAERLTWDTRWERVLDWDDAPFAKWFVGGKLNVAANCVDRHVEAGLGDRVAIHWVGEPGDSRTITYADLLREVSKTANALSELGLRAGDRVAIQMPMIPEAIYSMLACARLGLVHSVVFGGFSSTALRTRIDDAQARLLITSDGQYRRGAPAPMKDNTDEATAHTPSIEHVLVVRRTGGEVGWTEGRDVWWHKLVDRQPETHAAEAFDAEHPLFILYTSGTTGNPKGILHTSGGYLTQASYTHHAVFDLKPETDVYWCTADIGWITGHSYIVYGPLSNAVTQVVYEGTPNTPHEGRHWEIIQEHRVSIYYTAPTLIRTFMKWGADIPARYDLSSLRVLGSVGEPINPEAWIWYRENIGANRTPIVDTWWQTETGAIMISPLPGVTHTKPGSAQRPLPGISAKVVDDQGREVAHGGGGYLVLDQPWPSMLRGIWGDDERYRDTYWSRFADLGFYFAGDGAKYDADGDIWLLGRVDDVMNVSGHRISTTEVESALVSHPTVAEAAVVGASDATTGQGIVAFVILRGSAKAADDTVKTLRDHVASEIGPIAKPRQVLIVNELPKTRSGKIMRRLLRDVAENRAIGDTTTLADSTVMDLISSGLKTNTSED
ncbi:acetyl-CoA synthetase [Actinokineospora baliensis]|nr:acetyl-CoA synthetase [Actinokineospora baliensis]